MEILFYHLEQTPLERALPQLLEKVLDRGWRAVVEPGSPERAQALDSALWTYSEESFLPHGLAGGAHDGDQPILIATEPGNPNKAQVRLFVDRALPRADEEYERLVFMFDGHDPDAIAEARDAWKHLRDAHTVTYWQQDENGRWAKKG